MKKLREFAGTPKIQEQKAQKCEATNLECTTKKTPQIVGQPLKKLQEKSSRILKNSRKRAQEF